MKAAAQFCLFCLLIVGLVSVSTPTDVHAQVQPRSGGRGAVPRSNAATRGAAPTRSAPTRSTPTRSTPTRSTSARSASGPSTAVAVLDVSYIFEHHAGFKNAMEQMKKEVQQFEEKLRASQQILTKEQEQMRTYSPGSPEYEKLERKIADKAAKLQVDMQLKKKEFLTRESKVYFTVYQDVSRAVREFAEMKGIDLVLRHTGASMQSDNRTSVLQGVNRSILYYGNLDITREILDRLNRTQRPTSGGSPSPRVSRQQPRKSTRSGR